MTREQKRAQRRKIRRNLALITLAFIVVPVVAAYLVEYVMPACM